MAKITSSDALDLIVLSKASAPIGEVKHSMLTLAQFQAENLGTWLLADGSSCVGTAYQTLTGNTVVPDMRGAVPRMKGYSSGKNPDGDLALGTYQADMFASHTHGITTGISTGVNNAVSRDGGTSQNSINTAVIGAGGNETRMKNVTVNFFIKVGY